MMEEHILHHHDTEYSSLQRNLVIGDEGWYKSYRFENQCEDRLIERQILDGVRPTMTL